MGKCNAESGKNLCQNIVLFALMDQLLGLWGKLFPKEILKIRLWVILAQLLILRNVKYAEEEFKKMNKKLEAIIDAIPDLMFEVIWMVQFITIIPIVMICYCAPETFLGKTFSEVLPPDAANLALSAIREASEKGFSTGRQYTLELPNGLHWFELSIAPMKESEDHEIHFICLSRDITKVKIIRLCIA